MHCLGSDPHAGTPGRNVELEEFATFPALLQLAGFAHEPFRARASAASLPPYPLLTWGAV